MKKEYRVVAEFSKVYTPRSYKGKGVETLEDAEKLLRAARDYYSHYPYLVSVRIESREVSEWVKQYD